MNAASNIFAVSAVGLGASGCVPTAHLDLIDTSTQSEVKAVRCFTSLRACEERHFMHVCDPRSTEAKIISRPQMENLRYAHNGDRLSQNTYFNSIFYNCAESEKGTQ